MMRLLFLLLVTSIAGTAFAQQKTLLLDKFSDNQNGWTERDNEKASASIAGGAYKIVHHKPEGSYLFLLDFPQLDPSQDFTIQTRIKQFQGSDADGFGLVWGCKDAGNFFGFNINGASQFRVYRYKDQDYTEIKSFTPALNAVKSKGMENTLAIRKIGPQLSFYVNDRYVYAIPFQDFLGTQLGYVLYNQTEIHALDLKITQGKAMPLVFEDGLSDNTNNWVSTARDSSILRFNKGNLAMRSEEEKNITFKLWEKAIDKKKDFEIEANIRQLSGKKNKGYGLAWGAADEGNAYMLLINSFGSYAVYQRKKGQSIKLVDWTPSDQLLHLSVQPNKLVVRKVGKQYSFYLNDIWLRDIPYQDLMGDQLGFVATADLVIEASSLAIREGEKSYTPKPPVIALISPNSDGLTIDSKALNFSAGIKSPSPVTQVKVKVNGTEVPSQTNMKNDGDYPVMVEQALTLAEGSNEITVEAQNQDGLVQTSTVTVTVKTPNQPIVRNGNDYALFFATDDYDQWTDLVNPVRDARTIAQELEQYYGFNTELVIGASRKEILRTLKEYARRSYGPNDQLLIFFAGHGRFDEFFGEGYVVCSNSEKDDEGNNSYLSHSSLRTIVNNIPCQHTFLVMDVCFGGTIDPFIAQGSTRGGNNTGPGDKEMTQTEFIDRKMKFKTRKYLTSGGKEYVPDGSPGSHSPFTRKFLEGLRNYGGHDKIITLGELVLYFERLLPEPRFGEFGSNEPGSDFLFIAR